MQQPDIIFVVLDTQRADRLGCYGYGDQRPGPTISPNLDRFAGRGTLFERAVAPAQWTIPSHASFFTGLYPTEHQLIQSDRALGPDRPHLAELLSQAGYQSIGFCNNPLVGILNNGLKRGFQTFYNYGGAIPSMPGQSTRLPWPLNRLLEGYTQFLRRISYPIQNFFGQSDLAFRLSLNAWATPIWSQMANFKGQNARSVRDVTRFLETRELAGAERPLFLFLNLMETHLPFRPPGEFIERVAPYMLEDREARDIMRRWNREAYRWAAPLSEPLPELESRVLSDMYDAEVAYQDDYLGPLFELLGRRARARDTLTVIVSDHGDGLGEHQYFGHAFVAYEELLHVPLILHWPARVPGGKRIQGPVSTRRIYHTILNAAGYPVEKATGVDPAEMRDLTLLETIRGRDPETHTAYAEVYPPMNFAKAIRHRQPELLTSFRCLELRRAVVRDEWKLIHLAGEVDELFNLDDDPMELTNRLAQETARAGILDQQLKAMVRQAEATRDGLGAGATLNLEQDEQLMQRLRGLGYIE
jgi:arylsulfatase A-like enzyme